MSRRKLNVVYDHANQLCSVWIMHRKTWDFQV
jgi:hypothetical protein